MPDFELISGIPLVDFSAMSIDHAHAPNPQDESVQTLCAHIHRAFSTVGFVYLKNHGIGQDQVTWLSCSTRVGLPSADHTCIAGSILNMNRTVCRGTNFTLRLQYYCKWESHELGSRVNLPFCRSWVTGRGLENAPSSIANNYDVPCDTIADNDTIYGSHPP